MKKVLLIMAAALVMVSCGNKKATPTKGEVEVNVPCTEFKTDKKTLRANGNAISPNMQNATDKAIAAARREMATSVEAVIKRVTETYASSYDLDNEADFRGKVQDMARIVTSQTLRGSVPVCDKVTKVEDKNGVMYHAYVALELTTNEFLEALTEESNKRISNDEKLRTDFELEKFKKVFEEEMNNFAEGK